MINFYHYTQAEKLRIGSGESELRSIVRSDTGLLWVDIEGLAGVETVLTEIFEFHPLAVEDTMSHRSIPKVEEYENHAFAVFKLLDYSGEDEELRDSEVDIFLSDRVVVTVHENPHRVFDFLRTNAAGSDRMMSRGPELLFHAIVDAVVDSFDITLDVLESQVDEIEEIVLEEPDDRVVKRIFRLRRNMAMLKRVASPQREALARILDGKLAVIPDRAKVFFRDIYDHLNRINDIADSNRETLIAALEVYFSSVSTKTNDAIKVLTIFTAALMPPTFMVGLWGMNFKYMPELEWEHGYSLFWILLFLTTSGLLVFFKKKKFF